MLQSLEPRMMFSGVVTVTTAYGPDHVLLVRGDDATNEVAYYANFSNGFEEEMAWNALAVFGGRLIVDGDEIAPDKNGVRWIANAGGGHPKLYSLSRKPVFDLGGGDDALLLIGDRENAYDATTIHTGDGNDRVTADGVFYGLTVDTGAGNDRVTLRTGLDRTGAIFGYGANGVHGDLNIYTGAGRDRVLLDSDDTFFVRGKLRIVDHSGPTTIGMHAVRAWRGMSLSTGNSVDTIVVNACSFRLNTFFSTRGGNDVIRLHNAALPAADHVVFLTGAGRDVLERF